MEWAELIVSFDRTLRFAGALQSLVRINEAEAVQAGIDLFDPGQARPDDVDRRELALTDAAGELVRRREAEVQVDGAQRTTSTSQGAW